MEKILTKELLEQIRLMSYDRSMTLNEQTIPSDRLGKTGEFQPDLPTMEKTQKKQKSLNNKQEELDKYWKPRICRKRHEEMCQTFGGTKVYRVEGSVAEEKILGYGYTCGCKVNGEITIGSGKVQKVNEYLMNPFTKFTYNVKDFLQDEHNVLMIGSIIFTFGGLPLLGLSADIIDASVYISEGNPYMAGLNFLFSVVPLDKVFPGLKTGVKTFTRTIINKLKKGIPLDEFEEKVVKYVTGKKAIIIAYKRLYRMMINGWLRKYDIFYIVRIILWLVKKGVLATQFLVKWGLLIGGVFYSWKKISEILGISENREKSSEFPRTKIYDEVRNYLEAMNQKGYSYSTSLKNTNLPEIAAVQYVLSSGGYYNTKKPSLKIQFNHLLFENSDLIKSVRILTTDGKLIEEFKNNGENKFTTNKTLKNGTYVVDIKKTDDTNEKIKINVTPNSSQLYNINKPKIKWGYYDDTTRSAVVNFQKNNGLTPNGILSNLTLKQMLTMVKNNKISNFESVDNYANYKFDSDENVKVKTNEKLIDELNKALKDQEKQVADSIINQTQIEYDKLFEKINVDSALMFASDISNY